MGEEEGVREGRREEKEQWRKGMMMKGGKDGEMNEQRVLEEHCIRKRWRTSI